MIPTHCPTCKRRYTKSDKAKAYQGALRARAAQKSAAKQTTRKKVRAAVEKRAAGKCEACGWEMAFTPLRWDHWLGGSGRRIPKQSVETTWMLCSYCERRRTDNDPSSAYWNDKFERHCRKYGYRFYAHVEHKPLRSA